VSLIDVDIVGVDNLLTPSPLDALYSHSLRAAAAAAAAQQWQQVAARQQAPQQQLESSRHQPRHPQPNKGKTRRFWPVLIEIPVPLVRYGLTTERSC
jgi:hypothetical protein